MSAIVYSSNNARQDESALLLAEDRQWEALATDIMVNEAADMVDSLEQLLGSALKAVKTQRKDHGQGQSPVQSDDSESMYMEPFSINLEKSLSAHGRFSGILDIQGCRLHGRDIHVVCSSKRAETNTNIAANEASVLPQILNCAMNLQDAMIVLCRLQDAHRLLKEVSALKNPAGQDQSGEIDVEEEFYARVSKIVTKQHTFIKEMKKLQCMVGEACQELNRAPLISPPRIEPDIACQGGAIFNPALPEGTSQHFVVEKGCLVLRMFALKPAQSSPNAAAALFRKRVRLRHAPPLSIIQDVVGKEVLLHGQRFIVVEQAEAAFVVPHWANAIRAMEKANQVCDDMLRKIVALISARPRKAMA